MRDILLFYPSPSVSLRASFSLSDRVHYTHGDIYHRRYRKSDSFYLHGGIKGLVAMQGRVEGLNLEQLVRCRDTGLGLSPRNRPSPRTKPMVRCPRNFTLRTVSQRTLSARTTEGERQDQLNKRSVARSSEKMHEVQILISRIFCVSLTVLSS